MDLSAFEANGPFLLTGGPVRCCGDVVYWWITIELYHQENRTSKSTNTCKVVKFQFQLTAVNFDLAVVPSL